MKVATPKIFFSRSADRRARRCAGFMVLPLALAALGATVRAVDQGPFPWENSPPLRELARNATVEGHLAARSPQPSGPRSSEGALLLNNPDIKASLWGP